MSLISPRNLVAPLSNGVHLATILLVALLFGIFRWADGGVRFAPNGGFRIQRDNQFNPQVLDSEGAPSSSGLAGFDPRKEIQRLGAGTEQRQAGKFSNDDLLGELIGKDRSSDRNGLERMGNGAAKTTDKADRDADLDEIERSLGMK